MRADVTQSIPASAPSHIPTGSAVVVTFGRNVKGEPLHDVDWELFDEMVVSAINDLLHPTKTFGPFDGPGEWDGDVEVSRTYIALSGYPIGISEWEERLATLARIFQQEAIAYTYGPNVLVSGDVMREVAA